MTPGFHSIVKLWTEGPPRKTSQNGWLLGTSWFFTPGVLLEATQCCYLPLAYSSISARIARLDWYWHSFGHCRERPPNCPLCTYPCCSNASSLGKSKFAVESLETYCLTHCCITMFCRILVQKWNGNSMMIMMTLEIQREREWESENFE